MHIPKPTTGSYYCQLACPQHRRELPGRRFVLLIPLIFFYQKGMLTTFPQCYFSLEFPETLRQNHICYHWLNVSGIPKIMHCGILIFYYFIVIITLLLHWHAQLPSHYFFIVFEIISQSNFLWWVPLMSSSYETWPYTSWRIDQLI